MRELDDARGKESLTLIKQVYKPHSNIMRLCLIPDHFLHVKLKENCPLPPPCKEWMTHKIGEVEQWLFEFLDRQATFDDLMSKEPMPPKKPTNEHNIPPKVRTISFFVNTICGGTRVTFHHSMILPPETDKKTELQDDKGGKIEKLISHIVNICIRILSL